MIPAFSSQVEEEEPAEQTANRLQGVGDQGSMVSKDPRHDVSQEVGGCPMSPFICMRAQSLSVSVSPDGRE